MSRRSKRNRRKVTRKRERRAKAEASAKWRIVVLLANDVEITKTRTWEDRWKAVGELQGTGIIFAYGGSRRAVVNKFWGIAQHRLKENEPNNH